MRQLLRCFVPLFSSLRILLKRTGSANKNAAVPERKIESLQEIGQCSVFDRLAMLLDKELH